MKYCVIDDYILRDASSVARCGDVACTARSAFKQLFCDDDTKEYCGGTRLVVGLVGLAEIV